MMITRQSWHSGRIGKYSELLLTLLFLSMPPIKPAQALGDRTASLNADLTVLAKLASRVLLSDFAGVPLTAGVSGPEMGCHRSEDFRSHAVLVGNRVLVGDAPFMSQPAFAEAIHARPRSIWPFSCIPVELRAEARKDAVRVTIVFSQIINATEFVQNLRAVIDSGDIDDRYRLTSARAGELAIAYGRAFKYTNLSPHELDGFVVLDKRGIIFITQLKNRIDWNEAMIIKPFDGDERFSVIEFNFTM